ncbi:MAG: glycosyltransferase [Candidatus Aegiribacteria sp.]|nr:glycosyltransferase [Candidatus Aegiribacteria sp.]
MRISIIGAKGIPGHHGVENVLQMVATRLVKLGHEVTILGYNSYLSGLKTYEGSNLIGFDGSKHYSLEMPSHILKEVAFLKSSTSKFDVVHIQSVDPCLLALSLRKHFPIVATSHGRVYMRKEIGLIRKIASRLAERAFMTKSFVKTAVSPVDAVYYQKRYSEEVKYIPNGLETPDTIQKEPLTKWNLLPNKYLLFSAGRIIPSKGLHVVLNAYDRLNTDIPLVIVGGPGYDGSYFKRMKLLASEKVIFTGFISDDSLWSIYGNALVSLFPSEYEAQSMTLLEFISLRVPVIYSDIPENKAVADGIGMPFQMGNPESFAAVISSFLKDSGATAKVFEMADEIRSRHDWDRITEQYVECYLESMNS